MLTNVVEIEEMDQINYFKKISQNKFTVSPEGNGVDCYRTWEALYLGVVPIVQRNAMTEYFKNIGLPIVTVNNWSEVDNYDQDLLNSVYDKLEHKFGNKAIYIAYWLDLINSKKVF